MRVWGTHIADELAIDLVGLLRDAGFDSTAAKIAEALTWGRSGPTLTPLDAECLLRALHTPPHGLVELRALLVRASASRPERPCRASSATA